MIANDCKCLQLKAEENIIKKKEAILWQMYRPPKVRPKNLTIGGRYFYG